MAWLTADCTRCSRSAPARKLPVSATTANICIWLRVRTSSMIYSID